MFSLLPVVMCGSTTPLVEGIGNASGVPLAVDSVGGKETTPVACVEGVADVVGKDERDGSMDGSWASAERLDDSAWLREVVGD
jgi:hypothetical protein